MSGSRAKQARRFSGRVAQAVLDIAIVPGACVDLPEQVASMRKQTHDGIIELTGARRRSGVSWREFHGQTDCLTALDAGWGDSGREDALRQFREFFANYPTVCVLVIASVQVTADRLVGPS